MISFSGIEQTKGWFREKGKDSDVVISSRIRLSRNLENHTFPGTMTSEEEKIVTEEVIKVFQNIENKLNPVYIGELNPVQRRMLLERNLISQDFSLQGHKAFAISSNEATTAMINEIDHVRTASFRGGLELSDLYSGIKALDKNLETFLPFAASLEMGYVTTELTNFGTGMRINRKVIKTCCTNRFYS